MFSMSRSTKKIFHSLKCATTVWRVMHFFVDSLLLVTQIGSNSITKCEVGKAKFWESLTYVFFTAILITYIKGGDPCRNYFGEGVCNDGYICYFFTEVIKFYWQMLLLYPGELYRLLGASSLTFNTGSISRLLRIRFSAAVTLYNRNYSAILATLQITSYVHSRNSS